MKPNFTLQRISESVCNHYGIEVKNLIKKGRKAVYSKPRQMYFYMANEFSQKTLCEIGEFVERDHATVHHGITKIRIEKEIYSSIKKDIEKISENIFCGGLIPLDIDLLKLTEHYSKTIID